MLLKMLQLVFGTEFVLKLGTILGYICCEPLRHSVFYYARFTGPCLASVL